MFAASAAVRASTVTSTVSGAWLTAANWSDSAVPISANAYVIDGETMDTPDAGGTFSGGSLTITSGILRLARSTTGTNTTSIPNFTMAGGSMYFYGNNYNATWNFQSAIAFTAGTTSTLNINRGNYIMDANLNGALTGSGNILLKTDRSNSNDNRSFLYVKSANNAFSGNWTVSSADTGAADRANLNANAANALGTGTVTLSTRGVLNVAAASGIDSLAGVALSNSIATLNLTNAWTNTAATLAMSAGTVNLGSATTSIGNLSGTGGSILATGMSSGLTVNQTSDASYGGTFGITGISSLALTKNGGANLTLTGTSSAYTGASTVNRGVLTIAGGIAGGSPVVVNGGSLAFSGSGLTDGAISVAAGATLDLSGRSAVFALASGQVLTAGRASAGGNDILGNLATGAGTLRIVAGTTPGTLSISNNLTFSGGIINFDLAATAAGVSDTIVVGGVLDLNAATTVAINRLAGSLGAGTYVLAQAASITGSLTNVNFTGISTAASRQTITPSITAIANALTLTVSEGSSASLIWNGNSATGIWSLGAGDANWQNTITASPSDVFYNGDSVEFIDLAGISSRVVSVSGEVQPTSLTVNNSAEGTAFTLAGSGTIAGGANLIKLGSGTLSVTGSHGFLGSTVINGGILSVASLADGGSACAIGAGSTLTCDGGVLSYTGSTVSTNRTLALATAGGAFDVTAANAVVTWAGTVSGDATATLTKAGAGQLTLAAANTFSGPLVIAAGALEIAGAGRLNGGIYTGDVTNDGTFTLAQSSVQTLTGAIANNSTVAITAAASQTLAGPFNNTGSLTINSAASHTLSGVITNTGTIAIDSAVAQNLTNTIHNNGAITIAGSGSDTFPGAIDGSGSLTKSGTGTLTLSRVNNTYSGAVAVNGGTLQLGTSSTMSGSNTYAFTGRSLAISGSTLYLPGYSTGGAVQTYNFASLTNAISATDSTISFYLDYAGTTKTFNGALDFSGSNTIRYASTGYSHTLNLNRAISGSGTLTFAWTGGATSRSINLAAGQTDNFTGSVVLGSASGQVAFNLGSALGASEYHINGSWSVNNNAAGGLDSAAAITLQSASAALNLNQPITNPALILTANSGGIALGSGTSSIGSFVLNSVGTVTLSSSGGMLTATDFDIRQGTLTGAGTLGGTASLTKSGAGTATILTNNTYSGATTVLEGTLAGTGSAGSVTTVTAGATLAPGGGIGTYACAGAVFDSTATFAVEVDTTAGTADKLVAGGAVTIHPAAILTLSDLGSGGAPNKLVLIDYTGGSLTGVFAAYPDGSSVPLGGVTYVLSYNDHSQVTLALPGYAAWAAANAPGESAAMDHDHDGVSNGIEYFMGQGGSSFTANPGVVNGKVSWPRGGNYGGTYGTDYMVQTSTDLILWTEVPITDTAHLNNGSPLEYTLPTGRSTIFVRLTVTGP